MSDYYVETKGLLGIYGTFRNVKKVHEGNYVGFIKQDGSNNEY